MAREYIACFLIIVSVSACRPQTDTTEEPSIDTRNASAPAAKQGRSLYPLMQGPWRYIDGAVLQGPKQYWNEMDDTDCYLLTVNGQELAWIFSAYQLPSTLLVFKCEAWSGDNGAIEYLPKGAVLGDTDEGFYEIIEKDHKPRLQRVVIPGQDRYSMESFCQDRMAYWANDNNMFSVRVYDFVQRKIIKQQEVGEFVLETDDTQFLPEPKWQTDCKAVVFDKHLYLKDPVVLSFQ